jgi:enamine deaminase RidA (YjgF/YER057c/UK114 family)
MIRKTSNADSAYSVVDLKGVRRLFASAVPSNGGDFEQQAGEAFLAVQSVAQAEGMGGSIVQQAIFLSDARRIETCRRIVREFYGNDLPATSYIPQSPCGGKLLEIEAIAVDRRDGRAEIRRLSEQTVTTRHDGMTWVHCANVMPETPAKSVHDRSLNAFQQLEKELVARGFRFGQVVRTWLYLGDIVGLEGEMPRYQKLNLARSDFYRNRSFVGDCSRGGTAGVCYPASTGIGADNRDVMMSCEALATERSDVVRLPLENPRQIAAHDYDHRYGPQSPKFSRAMAIIHDGTAGVFVSGTASIIDSESHHIGDIAGQTRETLDNIAALISEDNFRRHGQAGLGATLDDMAMLRVYIKRREDYAVARSICASRLHDLPVIYTVADMCRPELLVEIEGIAFCGGR